MAVREFDGVDDVIALGAGSLGALPSGAYTLVALVKPNTLTVGAVMALQVANSQQLGSIIVNSFNLRVYTDAVDTGAFVGTTDAEWQILVVVKNAGNVVPRFHRKKLGAGAWTHADGNVALPNSATAITRIGLGAGSTFGNLGLWKAQRMAVSAVFPTALSDLNIESIDTAASTQKLKDLGATGLWELNQASTATSVTDLVGSANQTSITGTTAVTGDDPAWTFGLAAAGSDVLTGTGDKLSGTTDTLGGSSDVLGGPKDTL